MKRKIENKYVDGDLIGNRKNNSFWALMDQNNSWVMFIKI